MQVRPIRPGEERAAGELLYRLTRGRTPTPRELTHFLAYAETLGADLRLQTVAVATDGAVVGCAMFFPMIDRTATATPPMCDVEYARPEVQVALMSALRQLAADRGLLILQAFCDVHDAATEAILTQSGFEFLATMLFMERAVGAGDRKCRSDNRIRWTPYSAERHGDFVRLIERSYEGTLDCSRLGEIRDVNLTLEAYRARGEFDPSLWLLGDIDGGGAAVILVIHHPDSSVYEVAYMAAAPEHRGKGLGRKAMEKGLSEVALRDANATVSLVVDEANTPAVSLYHALGFTLSERRRVHFSLLATRSGAASPGP